MECKKNNQQLQQLNNLQARLEKSSDLNKKIDIYEKILRATPQEWRIGQTWVNFMSWHMSKYRNDIFYVNDKELLSRYNEFMLEITIPRG